MNALYHKDVFLPAGIVELFDGAEFRLDLTFHAKRAAQDDRYGKVTLPSKLTVKGKEIVEAEVVNGEVTKIVVRTPHDAKRDAVYVLIPNYERATVKTVWFNLVSDKHKTLKKDCYSKF